MGGQCGYAVAPGVVDVPTLLWTTVGTALCSASANRSLSSSSVCTIPNNLTRILFSHACNSINQWIEVPYDAQMSRTRNRVLVRGALSPLHGFTFGIGETLSVPHLTFLLFSRLFFLFFFSSSFVRPFCAQDLGLLELECWPLW